MGRVMCQALRRLKGLSFIDLPSLLHQSTWLPYQNTPDGVAETTEIAPQFWKLKSLFNLL